MSKTKFVEITTDNGVTTVNAANIATLEIDGYDTVITLNITDKNGAFIEIRTKQYYNDLLKEISNLD